MLALDEIYCIFLRKHQQMMRMLGLKNIRKTQVEMMLILKHKSGLMNIHYQRYAIRCNASYIVL